VLIYIIYIIYLINVCIKQSRLGTGNGIQYITPMEYTVSKWLFQKYKVKDVHYVVFLYRSKIGLYFHIFHGKFYYIFERFLSKKK